MNLPLPREAVMQADSDQVREGLLSQLRPLEEKAESLRAELAWVEFEQAPIRAAIVGYDEERKKQAKSLTKAKPSSNQGKSHLVRAHVEAVCTALLSDHGSLSKSELERLAKAELSGERGYDLKGFGLRLKECFASGGFAVSADGVVSLVAARSTRVTFAAVDKTATERSRD